MLENQKYSFITLRITFANCQKPITDWTSDTVFIVKYRVYLTIAQNKYLKVDGPKKEEEMSKRPSIQSTKIKNIV